jgi:hypothetical protein
MSGDLEMLVRAIVRDEIKRALEGAAGDDDDDELRRMARERAAKLRRARETR